MRLRSSFSLVYLCCFIALAYLCYAFGFDGGFLLDDIHSIGRMDGLGGLSDKTQFWEYVWTGASGPTGRPLSYLSFALNADSWPNNSRGFLQYNALIHCVNGLLLYLFLAALCKKLNVFQGNTISYGLPLLITIIWVTHPYHASTVLYAVQRMALLSAFFSLCVLIAYLYLRDAIKSGAWGASSLLAAICFTGFFLGLLSKESIVILPMQLAILELLFNRFEPKKSYIVLWQRAVIFPVAAFIVFYLLWILIMELGFLGFRDAGRNFTVTERLLTQLRVVGDYLLGILMPFPQGSGVYHDNYLISKGLFSPFTTAIWLAVHLALIGFAWVVRKRWPILFFGVAWFYGSLLLESSAIMLELKFEHRNYLASIGVITAVSWAICQCKHVPLRNGLIFFSIFICILFLFLRASLWGKPYMAAEVWVEENPRSFRALEHAARMALQRGDEIAAKTLLRREVLASGSPTSELRYFAAFCEPYEGEQVAWRSLASRIERQRLDWRLWQVLSEISVNNKQSTCLIGDVDGYIEVLDAYRKNPVMGKDRSVFTLFQLEISVLLRDGRNAYAMERSEYYLGQQVPLMVVMNIAPLFAEAGEHAYAIKILASGIQSAKAHGHATAFELINAEEILQLIIDDQEGQQ